MCPDMVLDLFNIFWVSDVNKLLSNIKTIPDNVYMWVKNASFLVVFHKMFSYIAFRKEPERHSMRVRFGQSPRSEWAGPSSDRTSV